MSTKVSTDVIDSSQQHDNKWDNAIKDAENEIDILRKQAYRLRHAVEIFKKNKRDGVPWPGEGKNDAVTR